MSASSSASTTSAWSAGARRRCSRLSRVSETSCGETWPNLRRELERLKVGTFTGPAGTFRQRTEITASQRAILGKLKLAEPPRIQELTPAATAS